MREIKYVDLCNIIIIDNVSLNPKTLDLAIKLKNNEINIDDLPPVKLFLTKNGQYILKNGRHRYTAFKLCGIEKIKANVSRPRYTWKKD